MTTQQLTKEFQVRLTILSKLFELAPDRGLVRAGEDLILFPKDVSNQKYWNELQAYKDAVNHLVARYSGQYSASTQQAFTDKIFKAGMNMVNK